MRKLFTKNVVVTAVLAALFVAGTGLVLAVGCLDTDTADLDGSRIVYLTGDPCDLE